MKKKQKENNLFDISVLQIANRYSICFWLSKIVFVLNLKFCKMSEKRKLLQRYMRNLSDLQDELKRKELEKKMKELEMLQAKLARRQEQSGTKCAGGKIKNLRQKNLRKVLGKYMMTLEGFLCELARREARLNGDRGRASESENLPHPQMLEEYTVAFCAVGKAWL